LTISHLFPVFPWVDEDNLAIGAVAVQGEEDLGSTIDLVGEGNSAEGVIAEEF